MSHGLISFSIHFATYWALVWAYDDKHDIQAVRNSLKNQVLSTLPLCLLFFNHYPIVYTDIFFSLCCIPLIIVMSDFYFYCSHRPLHTSLLWKYHRTHHHNTVSVAKSLDADLLEHVIGNLGSFIIGFLVFWYYGVVFNVYVYHMWVLASTLSTCVSHSNKRVFGDRGIHEIHHKHLKYNFGTGFYLMDRIMGTYRK